jgi:hypothetical protein
MEDWINAYGYPSYEVSTYGRVRNKKTGYILKAFPDRYGYLRLSLGNTDNVYIHRLVCESFYGLPENESCHVNHIDADRQNNHILNLEWCSPSENIRWGVRKGNLNPIKASIRAREINMKPVRIVELDKIFSSVKECAEYLGINPNRVSRCLVGERKGQRLHGYHIEFI